MKTSTIRFLVLSAGLVSGGAMVRATEFAAAQTSATKPSVSSQAHQDHNPKHGGTFFMAMDNRHHVEGLLVPPGIFRLYLYDAHTKPVPLGELKQATGTVQWGDSQTAPQIPLMLAKNGQYLEAIPDKQVQVKLPVELTLRLHLPGETPKAKPELFTFPFSHYTEEGKPAEPMHDHSGMSM